METGLKAWPAPPLNSGFRSDYEGWKPNKRDFTTPPPKISFRSDYEGWKLIIYRAIYSRL